MKTRVALILPSFRAGGAERVLITLLKHLDKNLFEIQMIVLDGVGPNKTLLPNDATVVDLHCHHVRNSPIRLIKAINKYNPDVILSTLGHLNLILLVIRKFLKNSPRIIVREACLPSDYLNDFTSFIRKFVKPLHRHFYKQADLIIAQCNDMREEIINIYRQDEKRVVTVYNPVDLKYIYERMKEFNPYPAGTRNILGVGRLSRQKGFDTLINAFQIAASTHPDLNLTILGDGELRDQLIDLVNEYGLASKVQILSHQENPYPYYFYSDVFVLSSRWEGFPNTLLEAIACQTKVVTTDCRSGPREILELTQCGIITPMDDAVKMAHQITATLGSSQKTTCNIDCFDVTTICGSYAKILMNQEGK